MNLNINSPGREADGESATVEVKIWTLIHDDRVLKNPAGMKAYLEDNGIVEIDHLRFCDVSTFDEMKAFFKPIPKKQFEKLVEEFLPQSCY